MKYCIKPLVAMILIFFNISFGGSSELMREPGDDFIVNSIKKISDLTQSDVNKWKFLWLGRAAEPIAGLAALYGVTSAGEAAVQAHDQYGKQVKNILTGELLPQFLRLPQAVQNVASSKELWVTAGAAGVGYAAYKYLYPRVTVGIRNNIKALNDLCSQLGVCTRSYQSIDQLKADTGRLASAAMTDASSQGEMARNNRVWSVGSAIALENGLDNVSMQREVALQLLTQLQPSAENQKLSQDLDSYGVHLANNHRAIQNAVAAQKYKRVQDQSEHMSSLKVKSAEAWLTGQHIKNVQNVWRTLRDIAEFGIRHKGPIVGAIAGTTLYRKFSGN